MNETVERCRTDVIATRTSSTAALCANAGVAAGRTPALDAALRQQICDMRTNVLRARQGHQLTVLYLLSPITASPP